MVRISYFYPFLVSLLLLGGAHPTARAADDFQTRFSQIAPDIQKLSDKNLQNLREALTRERNFPAHEAAATLAAETADRELVLNHATNDRAALAILKSGEILSVDEMVRRKLRSADQSANTYAPTDGAIGEQDVVYLAMQTDTHPFDFGPVAFTFEKDKVLDDGYFSLNSFTNGWQYSRRTVDDPSVNLSRMVNDYRPMVFRGRDAYRELLALSLANDAYLRSQGEVGEAIGGAAALKNSEKEVYERMGRERKYQPDWQTATLAYDLLPLLSGLGQLDPACTELPERDFSLLKDEEIKGRALANALLFWNAKTPAEKVLRSFAFFPPFRKDQREDPLLTRNIHDFWEVKVPRALSLDRVTAVAYSLERMPTGARAALEAEIANFAKSKGWKVKREEVGAGRTWQMRFTFDKT